MVFNFIESGINLFDDTFNTIKTLFVDVATQAAVDAIANRVTNIENSTSLTIINNTPSYTPNIRMGGYQNAASGGGYNKYFYIDWGLDSTFNNYFRLQIKVTTPYIAALYIKETNTSLTRLFTFNIT